MVLEFEVFKVIGEYVEIIEEMIVGFEIWVLYMGFCNFGLFGWFVFFVFDVLVVFMVSINCVYNCFYIFFCIIW